MISSSVKSQAPSIEHGEVADNASTAPPTRDASSRKLTAYTLNCALVASVGSLLYGIDSGIISTTISQKSYLNYFAPYTADIAGAVVSTFGAGSFVGVVFAGWAADKWGRKRTVLFAAVWALIAGIVQAASVHVEMLIVGRIIGGFAVGVMNMTIPIYNAEISPPSRRGMVSGLHPQFVGLGFALANWVGFACSYASGEFQWRFPLAVQCIPALILLVTVPFLPYSPRWLLEKGRDEEALQVLRKLSLVDGDKDGLDDYNQMRMAIEADRAQSLSFSQILKTRGAKRRLGLAVAVQVFTQLCGINVINYYQTTLYTNVGVTGHTVTLLAALYGLVGPAANVVCLLYVDKWGRKPTMWITGLAMACDMSIIMGLTAAFAGSDNKLAQGFTIAFIFLFSIIYSLGYNSIHYIYVPEILNQSIRARGSAIAVCSNIAVNIVFNQISPRAFASVGYRYYAVFISLDVFSSAMVATFFVETKGKTLEEIGALFERERVN